MTDLSVGAPPAAEAPLCVFQVFREAICGVDTEGTWCQAGEEDRDSCAKSTGRITFDRILEVSAVCAISNRLSPSFAVRLRF